jgi:O-acetyl-ADP-ribose deacetylase
MCNYNGVIMHAAEHGRKAKFGSLGHTQVLWPTLDHCPPPAVPLVLGRADRLARRRDASTVVIEARQGDITEMATDAIVNAANEQLRRGGGVCGAIFAAAGPELDEACAEVAPCATGEAVATPGFALPAPWIIHAVGPVWRGGGAGEPELLASCYRRSLEVADELGARSVAFPAISTGVFGYPPADAAAVAVSTVTSSPSQVERVVLVAFDEPTFATYRRLLA